MREQAPKTSAETAHRTVLLHEAVDQLITDPEGIYLDATFGRGGHSREILRRLSPAGRLIAIDRDPQAIEAAGEIRDPRFVIVHAPFAEFGRVLREQGVSKADGLLFDLGVSSPQLDQPERGFSFRADGPLDMRMDTSSGPTVAEYLASASQDEIATVLRDYGNERAAVQIAKKIVARRDAGAPVARSGELAALVASAVKSREPGQDPATRTFQALRIHVNAELAQIEAALSQVLDCLKPGGRLAVISFHSLEDALIKRFIQSHSRAPAVDRRQPFVPGVSAEFRPDLTEVARLRPSAAEVAANARSRSAILRVAQRA
ncbi:16S rRNA (cytosine(1402)-N(4))-methyltransferase RsmH [Thiomonas bhubaneswarensis]|uniref:Ribosomal RNA small subunit methyltransferase H n=1 Tax=Thiomonas bhubaneswarensis TaxID=339866 RepID=A0A0K6HY56_9BURK|nr:16S rRNA (cytosine(1402)-N(4))-methyltransferase RsmH [Thiomonas bhubaneswarensis]CUA95761.1 16S rRNA (cytosine(1402)-N(4))-methyltransferase [Thiomonas bhubaneswarensis]